MLCKVWSFSRQWLCRKPSSGTWRRLALVRTYISEERIAYINGVERISEVGTLAVTRNWNTQHASVASYYQQFSQLADSFHPDDGCDTFFKNSVILRATRRHSLDDVIIHSHRHETLKSYKFLISCFPLYSIECRFIRSDKNTASLFDLFTLFFCPFHTVWFV
jgi:hypothetical protein